jgi:DNA-binding response OmpR family regulator
MNKIVVVDDERSICEILEFNLKNEGFDVICCLSAEEAWGEINDDIDLVLLDVMMSGMSGYKMAEGLRNKGNLTPIIFLTAKDTENDMLTGFCVGGDDYISKPFSVKEVVARVKAVLKRANANLLPAEDRNNATIDVKGLTINPELKEITIKGENISLTKTEFELLLLLATNSHRIYSRQDLIDNLWKATPYITERTVDVHITRLRKKLGDYGCAITNRSGYGYRFDENILQK